jgi:hypothetical protein
MMSTTVEELAKKLQLQDEKFWEVPHIPWSLLTERERERWLSLAQAALDGSFVVEARLVSTVGQGWPIHTVRVPGPGPWRVRKEE